jgi:hypothetical protein
MSPHEKLRSLIDKLNKQPHQSTGGDGRMTVEVANTSAIAKGQAIDRYKPGKIAQTMPLRELQLKR